MYLDFVLFWAMTVPLLLVAVFLAAFSLPNDIANHTIYTVVTKPVRPTEIVLGRIIGFTAIGTMMLLVMGLVSYVFVVRTLDHQHTISGADLLRVKRLGGEGEAAAQGDRIVFRGRRDPETHAGTSRAQGHEHPLEIDIASGTGFTELVNQHRHEITQRRAAQRKTGTITGCRADSPSGADQPPPKASGDGGATAARIRVDSSNHGLVVGDLVKLTGDVTKITDPAGLTAGNDVWVVAQVDENSFALKDSQFFAGDEQASGTWEQVDYEVGSPQGYVAAKVPYYADVMQFFNREGTEDAGINVGNEWEYRKAIEGDTASKVEFHFSGLSPSLANANGDLMLQMTFGVFRTIKADIVSPVRGNIQLVHPDGNTVSAKLPFDALEFKPIEFPVRQKWAGTRSGSRIEDAYLFEDYVKDGELIVRITCASPRQYLTMAKYDAYFLAPSGNRFVNFFKACVGIWFQLVLVTSIGVALSTFLNGFVALLATGGALVASLFIDQIRSIADPDTIGGGPFESLLRVLNRSPMTTDLDPNALLTHIVVWLDSGFRGLMHALLAALPDLSRLSSVNFVAHGVSVPWNNLFVQLFMLLGFIIPLCLFAHYILKGREVAA
jgi:hypothetical protein